MNLFGVNIPLPILIIVIIIAVYFYVFIYKPDNLKKLRDEDEKISHKLKIAEKKKKLNELQKKDKKDFLDW